MRILITGNMGYVGPSVVESVRRSFPEATILGFDTGYFANRLTNAEVFPERRLNAQWFGDIRDFQESILDHVDAIIHLAALSNDSIGNEFEEVTLDVNWKATIRLAASARKAGVSSFIFASSCSIYGAADSEPRTERSTIDPQSVYAKSKVLAERDLRPLSGENFRITCLRFATACGMSPRLRLDLVLNDFVAAAVASREITLLSDGTSWRPLIDVKDMAKAVHWALIKRQDEGGDFLAINVGSNAWNYRVKELVAAVAGVIPGIDVSIDVGAEPDKRSYKVNFDRFKEIAPGHQPDFSLTDTIGNLRECLEAMNFSDVNFRNSHYMRLHTLRRLQKQNRLDHQLRWAE